MRYYFKIHTGDRVNAGTSSDITVVLYGEKGQTEAKGLRAFAHGTPFQRNQIDLIAVDFDFDAGYINQITLHKDAQLYVPNGWQCDYIEISKQPFDQPQTQCSIFKVNDWLIRPSASGTYSVSDGYPYTVQSPSSRIEEFSTGTITVPAGTSYTKTVTSGLTITIDQSTVKTTDISTGLDINLSQSALTAAFSRHINQSVTETSGVSLNKTEEYFDTINIGPFDNAMVYEVLWNKMIYTFHINMGEVHFKFDLPYKESFAGLKEVTSGNIIRPFRCRKLEQENPLFDNIGIALTRKCNAACRICCFECNTKQEETLTMQEIEDIIEQAKDIEGIKRIGFSGGEALLYPDLLFNGLVKAKEAGMSTSVTSNGFWGADDMDCRRILQEFFNVNLDFLTISVDHYHLEYIPLSSIMTILQMNREIGVPLTLAVGDSIEGKRAAEIVQELGEYAYGVNLILYPFMPVGRGKSLSKDALYKMDYQPDWRCQHNRHLAVLYDGSVYPCCSQAVYGSGLSMGNIREHTLKDLIDGYGGNCIFSTLKRRGLNWFMDLAVEKFGITMPSNYQSACHLCNTLFTNKNFVDGLSSYIEEEYQQTVHEFFNV